MTFRGMLFDFNGVLWWDEPQQMKSWARYTEEIRGRAFTIAELDERVAGRTVPDVLTHLFGHAPTQGEIQRCVTDKEGLYREMCLALGDRFQLSPGANPCWIFWWNAKSGAPSPPPRDWRTWNSSGGNSAWTAGFRRMHTSMTTAPWRASPRRISTCGPQKRSASRQPHAWSRRIRFQVWPPGWRQAWARFLASIPQAGSGKTRFRPESAKSSPTLAGFRGKSFSAVRPRRSPFDRL